MSKGKHVETPFNINAKLIECQAELMCPNCGYQKTELMPTDACVYFYECEHCKVRLQPLEGDCCVFCSYGSKRCPPIQAGDNCC